MRPRWPAMRVRDPTWARRLSSSVDKAARARPTGVSARDVETSHRQGPCITLISGCTQPYRMRGRWSGRLPGTEWPSAAPLIPGTTGGREADIPRARTPSNIRFRVSIRTSLGDGLLWSTPYQFDVGPGPIAHVRRGGGEGDGLLGVVSISVCKRRHRNRSAAVRSPAMRTPHIACTHVTVSMRSACSRPWVPPLRTHRRRLSTNDVRTAASSTATRATARANSVVPSITRTGSSPARAAGPDTSCVLGSIVGRARRRLASCCRKVCQKGESGAPAVRSVDDAPTRPRIPPTLPTILAETYQVVGVQGAAPLGARLRLLHHRRAQAVHVPRRRAERARDQRRLEDRPVAAMAFQQPARLSASRCARSGVSIKPPQPRRGGPTMSTRPRCERPASARRSTWSRPAATGRSWFPGRPDQDVPAHEQGRQGPGDAKGHPAVHNAPQLGRRVHVVARFLLRGDWRREQPRPWDEILSGAAVESGGRTVLVTEADHVRERKDGRDGTQGTVGQLAKRQAQAGGRRCGGGRSGRWARCRRMLERGDGHVRGQGSNQPCGRRPRPHAAKTARHGPPSRRTRRRATRRQARVPAAARHSCSETRAGTLRNR